MALVCQQLLVVAAPAVLATSNNNTTNSAANITQEIITTTINSSNNNTTSTQTAVGRLLANNPTLAKVVGVRSTVVVLSLGIETGILQLVLLQLAAVVAAAAITTRVTAVSPAVPVV